MFKECGKCCKVPRIQAHSHKEMSNIYIYPHIYKDCNHKPKMTFALTPFEACNGFMISKLNKM